MKVFQVLPLVLCQSDGDRVQAVLTEPLLQVEIALGSWLQHTELVTRHENLHPKSVLEAFLETKPIASSVFPASKGCFSNSFPVS